MAPMESVYFDGVRFGGSTHHATGVNNTKEEPRTRKNLSGKFILPNSNDEFVEREFKDEIRFSNSTKIADISQESSDIGVSRHTKSTEMHHNSRGNGYARS